MGQTGATQCNFCGYESIWAPSGAISCARAVDSLRLYPVVCSCGSMHFCAGVALDLYIFIAVAFVYGSVLSQRGIALWSYISFCAPPTRAPRAKIKNPSPLSISFYGTPCRYRTRHINPETLGHGPKWGDPM